MLHRLLGQRSNVNPRGRQTDRQSLHLYSAQTRPILSTQLRDHQKTVPKVHLHYSSVVACDFPGEFWYVKIWFTGIFRYLPNDDQIKL